MNVPGSNILATALGVIARQIFCYYVFLERTTNDVGIDVASYRSPVKTSGSVQPVPRSIYVQSGLDLQKNYYNVFLQKDVLDIRRDVSGDVIVYQGIPLQCLSVTNWFLADGWVQVLTVQAENLPYA